MVKQAEDDESGMILPWVKEENAAFDFSDGESFYYHGGWRLW